MIGRFKRACFRIDKQRASTLPLLEDLQADRRGIIVVAAISMFWKLGGSHYGSACPDT